MEYKKIAEEVKSSDEYKKLPEEQHVLAKEYFSVAEEYHDPAKEYFIEENREEANDITKKNHRYIAKKLRQMGYLVAASIAVVTVSQTIEPTISQDNGKQDAVIENSSGDIFIDVPGFKEDDGSEDIIKNEIPDQSIEYPVSEYLVVTSLEDRSTANGGVFLAKENGLWGLMNFSGEWLCEPKYNSVDWHAPNDSGYSVVDNDGIYYVLDSSGKEIFVWDEGAEEVEITDNNIIFVEQYGEFENDILAKASYWRVDGTKIYEVTSMGADIFAPTAFNDGIAVINMSSETEWDIPHMLLEDGTLQKIQNSEGNSPYFWVSESPYADGCYVGQSAEGWSLVEVATGNGMGAFWPDYVVNKYVPEFEYTDTYFTSYYENGQNLYNYGTYGCISAENGEEEVYILFDFRDANGDEYNLDRVIAVYDMIQIDDFPYLLAKQDGFYFYINWDGEIVSEKYTDATAFNEDGYAMIMPEEGTAYLINDRFEKLDSIDYVFEVGRCGDAFEMNQLGEDVIYVPEYELNLKN